MRTQTAIRPGRAAAPRTTPRTRTPDVLTEAEVRAVLATTAADARGYRDHVVFSLALGAGLRLSEIVALNVGDVKNGRGARSRIRLRPETTKMDIGGDVVLPERLRRKLSAFLTWKHTQGQSLAHDAPLFVSRSLDARLSDRMVEHAFRTWQQRARLDVIHRFHALRHTACTNLHRATGDLRLVQVFARHRSIKSTTIYTHPTAEDLARHVDALQC